MIPKIIHQLWDNPEGKPVPIRFQILTESFKHFNPSWEYRLWGREEMQRLVEDSYPNFLPTYNGFKENILRWDSIRYMILHRYGGLYVDLDIECLKPLDNLFEDNYQMYIGEEPSTQSPYPWLRNVTGNGFMASVQGWKGWLLVLQEIERASRIYTEGRVVFNVTGVHMLTRTFKDLVPLGAHALPYEKVSPVRKMDIYRYVYNCDTQLFRSKIGEAYCIHYFLGTWDKQLAIY